jgi:hypothetical protein
VGVVGNVLVAFWAFCVTLFLALHGPDALFSSWPILTVLVLSIGAAFLGLRLESTKHAALALPVLATPILAAALIAASLYR